MTLKQWLVKGLCVVGGLTCLRAGVNISKWMWLHYGPKADLIQYGNKQGSYVVITGGSDGIGKGLAIEASRRGFNLVLIARTESKLLHLQADLKSSFPSTNVIVLTLDCSVDNDATYDTILSICEKLDVSILINNVATTDEASEVKDQSSDSISRTITMNCTFLTKLTSKMIPLLQRRHTSNKKQRAMVVNISSFLSILPAGFHTVYSASKGYVNQFTSALSCELLGSGVDVMTMRPAHVCSPLSKIETPSATVPTPNQFAVHFFNKLGKAEVLSPFVPHALMEAASAVFPASFVRDNLREALKPKTKSL